MALYRIVPIANVHRSTGSVPEVDGDKAKVGGEYNVADIFLVVTELSLVPLQELNPVGRLVAHFDHAALQFLGPIRKVYKLLTANPRVGLQP